MVNIKLSRDEAEHLLDVYERAGGDPDIVECLKISLGMIKVNRSVDEAQLLSALNAAWNKSIVTPAA